MLKRPECEIAGLNRFYKFEFTHFSIRCIFFVLINRKTYEDQEFHILSKICEMRRKHLNAKLFG